MIKDAKAYLDLQEIIQYHLCLLEYSTKRSDNALITDLYNLEASHFWEGQLHIAMRDGSLRFLFDNKGILFHRKGFEMLAALDQHCCSDTMSNAFTMLMSLFNDVQGDSEQILAFRSRFDGLIMDMARSKIILPPILLVMLFLCALHLHYFDILNQFCSRYKALDTASINLVVKDVRFHDGFQLVGSNKKAPGVRLPKAVVATASNVDRQGTVWATPFEWLSSYGMKGIKTRWDCAIAGTGICPIYCAEKPWHMLADCLLLKELNLKLVHGPPALLPFPAPAHPPIPAPSTPDPGPSPGVCVASADDVTTASSMGSSTVPSGLMAAVAEDFDSDEEFCWVGNDEGRDYVACPSVTCNSTYAPDSFYPSCSCVAVKFTGPAPLLDASTIAAASTTCSILLPKSIHAIFASLSEASISPGSGRSFTIADSGATDHMFPDKCAFILYKSIQNLQVCMGNNSFLPVLGCGMAIISLNGQQVFVRNALHVSGLAVSLYSLWAHFQQRGCGFIGTLEAGMLVYFPNFVLLVDTSSDCHLAHEPLGTAAPLDTLHYVQPWRPPSLYLSKLSKNSVAQTPPLVEDDSTLGDSLDLALVTAQLNSLTEAIKTLSSPTPSPALPVNSPSPFNPPSMGVLLSTMSRDEVLHLLHHDSTSLPAVCPCNTANNSNTKTHCSAKELHRIMGCQKFRNYKQILQVSRDGEWVDGGEFTSSLGSFATIPKAKQGLPLDRTHYWYLDAVHMDIVFGNCLFVGGYCYALILVDCATGYNWTFGLKTLSSSCILAAIQLFRAAAGSLARCFYCDCNTKLFGKAISKYLVDNGS